MLGDMTFIERACHQRATEVWQRRPDIDDWHARVRCHVLQYCEVASVRPTSSASIVLFRIAAAVAAAAYRRKAPTLSEWRNSLTSEPRVVIRKASELYTKIEDEVRLHQDIFGSLRKSTRMRVY
jgi:hypothetical protein